MEKFLLVAAGGAAGSMLRYFISSLDIKYSKGVFPLSTFLVNVTGSLVIGFLWAMFEKLNFTPNLRVFVFVGILGGYTTFSSFALENLNLIRDGEYRIAIVYILLSNIIGIGLAVAGFLGGRYLAK